MPYSIPSSTKILTLATAPFLFILVDVLSSVCEFAMVPGVYILVCPRIKRYTLPPLIKKNLSAMTTKYILKCWERSVKRNSNLSFIRVIKNSSVNQRFLYGLNLSTNFWRRFLVPRSGHLFVSSATLSCKTKNILTLSILLYYNTNGFFLRSFSLMLALVCSLH